MELFLNWRGVVNEFMVMSYGVNIYYICPLFFFSFLVIEVLFLFLFLFYCMYS